MSIVLIPPLGRARKSENPLSINMYHVELEPPYSFSLRLGYSPHPIRCNMITPGHDIIVPVKTITSASYLPLLIAFDHKCGHNTRIWKSSRSASVKMIRFPSPKIRSASSKRDKHPKLQVSAFKVLHLSRNIMSCRIAISRNGCISRTMVYAARRKAGPSSSWVPGMTAWSK